MRKLATIRTVHETRAIDGADMIEMAVVDGWKCVTKKGVVSFATKRASGSWMNAIELSLAGSKTRSSPPIMKLNEQKSKRNVIFEHLTFPRVLLSHTPGYPPLNDQGDLLHV